MTQEEFKLLVNFHLINKRQGPGSTKDTLRAMDLLDLKFDESLKIADIGCGTGAHTFVLANQFKNATITSIDLSNVFLEKLNKDAKIKGFSDQINTLEASMDNLPFKKEEFDIIWSEGAIYNVGFETGLRHWKQFVKNEGFIVVSEITWLTNSRPDSIDEYWNEAYPEINTASKKIEIIEKLGFKLMGYFPIPTSSWLDNYYNPLEARFTAFLEEHNYSETVKNLVHQEKAEIENYKKFKDFYSYGFYILKKA